MDAREAENGSLREVPSRNYARLSVDVRHLGGLGPGGPALGPAGRELMSRIHEIVLENLGPHLVGLHPAGSAGSIPLPPRTRAPGPPAVAAEIRRLCGRYRWRMVPTAPRGAKAFPGAGRWCHTCSVETNKLDRR